MCILKDILLNMHLTLKDCICVIKHLKNSRTVCKPPQNFLGWINEMKHVKYMKISEQKQAH